MTEAEWLSCDDWRPMVAFLAGRMSKRKGMLYVCAGLRQIWDQLYDDGSRKAVETAERAADGLASDDEIYSADWAAESPTFGYEFDPEFIRRNMPSGAFDPGVRRLIEMGIYTEKDIQGDEPLGDEVKRSELLNAAHIAFHGLHYVKDGGFDEHLHQPLSSQARWPGGWLVREVFGNPFRTFLTRPDRPSWGWATVTAVARGIYDESAFDRLPILADALEESGCQDAAVLNHCRHGDRHIRGCWVVDAVLGLR